MAKYSITARFATITTSLAVAAINAPATNMRRIKLYDLAFGSETTPADTAVLWQFARCSTAGTAGSSVTPSPLDPADAACVAVAGQAYSVDPTVGVILFQQALNQRASFRWVAAPGSELVIPATANAGIKTNTPTINGSAPAGTTTQYFEEQ